jgi:hypothetical protein
MTEIRAALVRKEFDWLLVRPGGVSRPGVPDQGAHRLPGRCRAAAHPGTTIIPQTSILKKRIERNMGMDIAGHTAGRISDAVVCKHTPACSM